MCFRKCSGTSSCEAIIRHRSKPKFVTLQEFPAVGPLRVRIRKDLVTRVRILDIREILPTGEFSRYGVRLASRADLELLSCVILAVLQDPTLF
jgi:hypothetical protein